MGSYNATCGITQLPIHEKTPVVLFPLVVKQQDFLARDVVSGGGSSDNDLLAQPFSMPLVGSYDGYGGVEVSDESLGKRYLLDVLKALAEEGTLLVSANGDPKPMKAVSDDALEKLQAGELLLSVPNQRKIWLMHLKKTIEASANKSGFSHYAGQLAVDPATLPDHVHFALGSMLVPKALYDDLCHVRGAHKSEGRFSDKSGELTEFKGSRQEELAAMCASRETSIVSKLMIKMKSLTGGNPSDLALMLLSMDALKLDVRRLYFDDASYGVLRDAAFNDNAEARDLWVKFNLFTEAMVMMRKQWVPQCGAGDSHGLEISRGLYAATGAFIANRISAYEAQVESDNGMETTLNERGEIGLRVRGG